MVTPERHPHRERAAALIAESVAPDGKRSFAAPGSTTLLKAFIIRREVVMEAAGRVVTRILDRAPTTAVYSRT